MGEQLLMRDYLPQWSYNGPVSCDPVLLRGPHTAATLAFVSFHNENPRVWRLFVTFAFQLIRKGRTHYGAKAIMERVRFETDAGDVHGEFKINNNHTALYARAFALTYPEHKDFFRTRGDK